MPDEDGYPTDKELDEIGNLDVRADGVIMLLKKVHDLWVYPGRFVLTDKAGKRVLKLYLSTGGWSGNEAIIDALMANSLFWFMCWEKSERGGHYHFQVDLKRFNEG